jgi:transcription-repair coupling factor (superfamily II helicase)
LYRGATPIPRTLHMSLTGVRDLSTIDTPPEERLPIKTFVGDFDEMLVRQAILRELGRNGQVFFVHNRVQGIEQIAAKLAKIVPEVRIAVAHGQMPERELSAVMLAFAEGESDVLVCTSIIEGGLDIPNANTIIINRADMFGLAQLYQLRGRVGRSAARAYAYMLVDKYKALSEDARRRLEAIGFEEGQLLIKSVALETTDRAALQERLKAQGVSARVARRAIWLEMREADAWRRDLMKTLEAIKD